MTNQIFYKIAFYVVLILLIISIAIGAIYYIYFRPDYTELQRPQEQETEINIAEQIAHAKDSLSKMYEDSLQQSRNNVRVITRTIYKQQEQIIEEPITDIRVKTTLNYFGDFYDKKIREIGIDPSPEIKIPEITFTQKQFKGAELVISELNLKTKVNTELKKQVFYYEKQIVLKDEIIEQKDRTISLKESQLIKMEGTKVPVISSRKWTTDIATHGGAILAGFVLGIIYSNNK